MTFVPMSQQETDLIIKTYKNSEIVKIIINDTPHWKQKVIERQIGVIITKLETVHLD